ncbi:hypothetical protein B0H11DRAFT_1910407 [Mycena galericulata]|nr:hypothetical protein B0H11DRAFT_1910407 [Mycena galericulata]
MSSPPPRPRSPRRSTTLSSARACNASSSRSAGSAAPPPRPTSTRTRTPAHTAEAHPRRAAYRAPRVGATSLTSACVGATTALCCLEVGGHVVEAREGEEVAKRGSGPRSTRLAMPHPHRVRCSRRRRGVRFNPLRVYTVRRRRHREQYREHVRRREREHRRRHGQAAHHQHLVNCGFAFALVPPIGFGYTKGYSMQANMGASCPMHTRKIDSDAISRLRTFPSLTMFDVRRMTAQSKCTKRRYFMHFWFIYILDGRSAHY